MSIPPPRMVICFLTPSPFPWNFQVVPPPPQTFQSYLVWVWISSGDAYLNTALTLFAKRWHLWHLGLGISEIKEGSSSSTCRTLFKCRGIYLFSPLSIAGQPWAVILHRGVSLFAGESDFDQSVFLFWLTRLWHQVKIKHTRSCGNWMLIMCWWYSVD